MWYVQEEKSYQRYLSCMFSNMHLVKIHNVPAVSRLVCLNRSNCSLLCYAFPEWVHVLQIFILLVMPLSTTCYSK